MVEEKGLRGQQQAWQSTKERGGPALGATTAAAIGSASQRYGSSLRRETPEVEHSAGGGRTKESGQQHRRRTPTHEPLLPPPCIWKERCSASFFFFFFSSTLLIGQAVSKGRQRGGSSTDPAEGQSERHDACALLERPGTSTGRRTCPASADNTAFDGTTRPRLFSFHRHEIHGVHVLATVIRSGTVRSHELQKKMPLLILEALKAGSIPRTTMRSRTGPQGCRALAFALALRSKKCKNIF